MDLQKDKLIQFFRDQMKLEDLIIEKAEQNVQRTDNILISELIRGIALDSVKHKNMLNALITLSSGATPLIEESQMEALGEHIKEHIKLEEKAIESYKEQLNTIEDTRMKLILRYLVQDEQKHHALLTRIDKWIIQPQTLTEDELWDMIWKQTPFHGTPGG